MDDNLKALLAKRDEVETMEYRVWELRAELQREAIRAYQDAHGYNQVIASKRLGLKVSPSGQPRVLSSYTCSPDNQNFRLAPWELIQKILRSLRQKQQEAA